MLEERTERGEAPVSSEKPIEGIKETYKTPEPVAVGNEKIKILKHKLFKTRKKDNILYPNRAELAIRNISDSTIATAIFQASFYDREGNILDTVEHKEVELKTECSRGIIIESSITESERVQSYNIKLVKVITADVERFQIRRHVGETLETGEEKIKGIIKNISEDKGDTAVVATFMNYKREIIGTKVIILRDIEPNSIRQYDFKFKPQNGDRVLSCTFKIADIVE